MTLPIAMPDAACAIGIGSTNWIIIFKDYHNACSSYYESIKNGSVEKIEEIEKVRRKIHDDGAENLLSILNKDFNIDKNTSRRLFTLMYSLYI